MHVLRLFLKAKNIFQLLSKMHSNNPMLNHQVKNNNNCDWNNF